VKAEVYLGWCDQDATAPAEHVPVMKSALEEAGVTYALDWFTDAVHGYAPPGTDRYNRAASELHWERVHSMFRRLLQ
jgi:carboxymethylenebutenolidase